MSYIAEKILSTAHAMHEGGLLSPKQFLHLGSRAAIDKTLSRLTKEGKLLRVSRGIYTMPKYGRFGVRPPSTESVLRSIESNYGEIIVSNGASEANALGLTTQVLTREVLLTSGKSRTLHLGNKRVDLKRGSRWQLLLGDRPSGKAIRALSWIGQEYASAALRQLRLKLPDSEWEAVCGARSILPNWLAKAIGMEMTHG